MEHRIEIPFAFTTDVVLTGPLARQRSIVEIDTVTAPIRSVSSSEAPLAARWVSITRKRLSRTQSERIAEADMSALYHDGAFYMRVGAFKDGELVKTNAPRVYLDEITTPVQAASMIRDRFTSAPGYAKGEPRGDAFADYLATGRRDKPNQVQRRLETSFDEDRENALAIARELLIVDGQYYRRVEEPRLMFVGNSVTSPARVEVTVFPAGYHDPIGPHDKRIVGGPSTNALYSLDAAFGGEELDRLLWDRGLDRVRLTADIEQPEIMIPSAFSFDRETDILRRTLQHVMDAFSTGLGDRGRVAIETWFDIKEAVLADLDKQQLQERVEHLIPVFMESVTGEISPRVREMQMNFAMSECTPIIVPSLGMGY